MKLNPINELHITDPRAEARYRAYISSEVNTHGIVPLVNFDHLDSRAPANEGNKAHTVTFGPGGQEYYPLFIERDGLVRMVNKKYFSEQQPISQSKNYRALDLYMMAVHLRTLTAAEMAPLLQIISENKAAQKRDGQLRIA